MKRIFFAIQLPPPVHGASVINASIQNSLKINDHFECIFFNITTAKTLQSIGKFELSKFVLVIKIYLRYIFKFITARPNLLYITLSPYGVAFIKDCFFVLLAKTLGVPVIIHLHGRGIKESYLNSGVLIQFLYKKCFNNVSVIFLAEKLKNDIPDFFRLHNTYVLNNGISSSIEIGKDKTESKNTSLSILFLSNLIVDKGIYHFLEICDSLKSNNVSFKAKIVGSSGDLSGYELTDLLKAKNIDSHVEYLGPLYGDEKNEVLISSDILLFPTQYKNEAFPLVLLEALKFGVVPIANNIGGISEIIEDGVNGFLVSDNQLNKYIELVKLISSDKDLLLRLSNNANILFENKFTLQKFESALEKIFVSEFSKHN